MGPKCSEEVVQFKIFRQFLSLIAHKKRIAINKINVTISKLNTCSKQFIIWGVFLKQIFLKNQTFFQDYCIIKKI
jgi:hypothetical protein